MRRIKKLVFILVYAALLILFAELSSKIALSTILGSSVPEDYAEAYRRDSNLLLLTWMDHYEPHPYLGYQSPTDLHHLVRLTDKSPNEFMIGILGGSVAQNFALYLEKHPDRLVPLERIIEEEEGKKLRIVNLSNAGWKQPQQFFAASLYLDKLDLLINLDGLNEMISPGFMPLFPLEYPYLSLRHYGTPGVTPKLWAALGGGLKWLYVAINRLPDAVPLLQKSHAYHLFWQVSHGLLNRLIQEADKKFQAAAVPDHIPASPEQKLYVWARFSVLQARLAAAVGKPALFFLQPNQYLRDSKPLSEEERRTAFNPEVVDQWDGALRLARSEVAKLRDQGVNIFDLTDAFIGSTETVYDDACCHLNERGNEILAGLILSRAVDALTNARTCPAEDVVPQLMDRRVTDEATLLSAATELGLTPSDKIWGYVDTRNRTSADSISVSGWAMDKAGRPLSVVIFVDGKAVGSTVPRGPRRDVDPTVEDLAFKFERLDCPLGSKMFSIAVSTCRKFAPLRYWHMDRQC